MTLQRGSFRRAAAAAMCVGLAIGTAPAIAQTRTPPGSHADMQLSFAPVAARAAPAVVNVYAQRVVRGMARDPFFGRFSAPRIEQSLGSGVIVRDDGIIVTNNHVIEGAQSLKVVLNDRREYDAELVLADPRVDLAVLRINTRGERMPTLAYANTADAQVGDLVLAIGNPFGLQQTVTSGIISALARTEVGISDYAFFIQTDAAINRGNSGGALVDMQGRLIGINSAIASETGGSNGVGFAIPAEMVRRVVESAVAGGGTVVRPWLGARMQTVSADIARSLNLSRPEGVLVSELYPRAAGERAGLRVNDIILSVGGVEVRDEGAVRFQFATQRPGSRVPLTVLRDGRQITLTAAAEPPPGGAPEARELTGRHPLSGARVVTLTPATAEASGVDPFADGVFIQALDRRGIAARIGFRPGDIIDEVNGQPVRDAAQLDRLMAQATRWVIGVERNGQRAELRF
ncbi:MAG: Do family serine endopeptidase [Hyphomonadaceae bacterium]|nr:Do family serine endopeptidase [Hyphomonadaceae bacterium]GIK48161.1 MAG: serine protease [Alphaproteobacteria bacterium]